MNHLAFIVPAYAFALLLPAALAFSAAHRLKLARQRLVALDRRRVVSPDRLRR
jgi:hypothetical protein